ncbi:MAG: YicC family protein [Pirellulaceae bacterium]|nr:YicC family protein [Pirellulaceae bacterium]
MLLSMTGFGESQLEVDGLRIRAELRSVNSRHLKLSCRLPDGYAGLEPRIDSLIRSEIRRGTIQLSLQIDLAAKADDYEINRAVLVSYHEQLNHIAGELELPLDLQLERLVLLPGVIQEKRESSENLDELWSTIAQAISQAMKQLNQMRGEEGHAMEQDLRENCRIVGNELKSIRARAPEVVKAYQARLTERISGLLEDHNVQAEPADVVREVGVFSDRVDISEETVRLESHLQQFDKIMTDSESSGRKLDFVIQEMFRETNTIGSKANDATIARHVVEIKTSIERLREMIQNVE